MEWRDPDRRQAHERPEEDEALRRFGREMTLRGRVVKAVLVALAVLVGAGVCWWLSRGH